MSHNSSGVPDDERRRRAEQETTQQPVIGADGRPWQPPQQQQGPPPPPQPYAGAPAPPQSLGQGFGQRSGAQPQQPPQPQPQPQFQQPQHQQPQPQPQQHFQQQPQYQQPVPGQPHPGQQPYFPQGTQPCFPLVADKLSQPARLLGWIPVAIALIAFIGCFGTWATAKVSGSYLGTSMSISSSVNAFNHQSCKGTGAGAGACDEQANGNNGSSDSSSSPSATGDEGGDLWEGWVVSLVALLVAGLGVVRGLGKRVAALPAAITAAVGGLVLIGLPVYRLIWIGDKSGDFADSMKSSGMPSGFDTSLTSGWGLWLVLIMGVAMLAAGIGGAVKRW
ncbi:hypothetical protein [Flexivirga meconopsidis]|uniref:hypothetical protein n=1 Tax=Flexivirga meconopsidis TaxID=2977121 RepID=UPI00223ECA96|nr:hypothetical protein [Flexivirga meconopsidis]